MRFIKSARAAAGLLGVVLFATPAASAELTVIASTPMTEILEAVLPMFERESGHKVNAIFLAGAALPDRVKGGAQADLLVTLPQIVDDLVQAGKVVAGSRIDFVRSRVSVAVRAGAPKPDISTVEGFKNALLAAKSVGMSQGSSGVYLMELLERLGIADAVKAKVVIPKERGQRVGVLVASGQAEIGVQQITELLPIPGSDFVGPLPPALQTTIVFAMARPTNAKAASAVNDLVKFLSSKSVAPIARKMGLEPA